MKLLKPLAQMLLNQNSSGKQFQAQIKRFDATLARHGRPHGERHREIYYSMSLADLIRSAGENDGILCPAPWMREEDEPLIFEWHSSYHPGGWWAEADERVLLHVPCTGNGLSVLEVACILAESPDPAQELVDAISAVVEDHKDHGYLPWASALTLLPDSVRAHIGPAFTLGFRKAVLGRYRPREFGHVFSLYESWTIQGLNDRGFGC